MRSILARTTLLLALAANVIPGQAQISSFQHIVLLVQENRTPDDLFQGLCLPPYGSSSACGTGTNQYDIQSYGYDENGNKIALLPVPLGYPWGAIHSYAGFLTMCNANKTTHYPCSQNTRLSTSECLPKPTGYCSFEYVDPNSTPTIYPYLYMAQNFGWANRMFQTNQGPSAPAHQFLFGGTSAPSAADDAAATFLSENSNGLGCLAPLNTMNFLISPAIVPGEAHFYNNPLGTFCFTRDTMATLLEAKGLSWRYYSQGMPNKDVSESIWSAPNWIEPICQPNSTFTQCTGKDWIDNVDLKSSDILLDLQNCNLKNMVWVIPIGQNSDHPSDEFGVANDGGPAWVANVINGVSSSPCTDAINGVNVPYWQDTAVIVTWDDWGGFYDHVLPPFLSPPKQGQGDYQLGFRVPLLVVSAYTGPIIDITNQYDFGSILRFAEHNFGITEGALGFADKRANTDLTGFFNLKAKPKTFNIPTNVTADFFLHDTRIPLPPDDD